MPALPGHPRHRGALLSVHARPSDLGVPTILDDQGPQKVLKFHKGPYLVDVGITWLQTRGGSSVYALTPEELMPLAKSVVNKVP